MSDRLITDIWKAWKKGTLKPQNQRQTLILQLWEAFLDKHPADFDDMVHTVPDSLTRLYQLAGKAPDVVRQCMREPGHDGPCNGMPCETALERMKELPYKNLPMLKRMWVNQPGIHQTLHKHHGRNVLADLRDPQDIRIYFVEGPTISSQALLSWLSEGWTEGEKKA